MRTKSYYDNSTRWGLMAMKFGLIMFAAGMIVLICDSPEELVVAIIAFSALTLAYV